MSSQKSLIATHAPVMMSNQTNQIVNNGIDATARIQKLIPRLQERPSKPSPKPLPMNYDSSPSSTPSSSQLYLIPKIKSKQKREPFHKSPQTPLEAMSTERKTVQLLAKGEKLKSSQARNLHRFQFSDRIGSSS